jgi:hypothetical protein
MMDQVCENRIQITKYPPIMGAGRPTEVGRPPSAAGPSLWVALWMGISLLVLLRLHISSTILATHKNT